MEGREADLGAALPWCSRVHVVGPNVDAVVASVDEHAAPLCIGHVEHRRAVVVKAKTQTNADIAL